jgi:putative membrane protein
MKKLFLPALLSAALLAGTAACTDNKGDKPDATATADNNADDNYMGAATNGESTAMNDGDTTGSKGSSPESRTGPMGMNGNTNTGDTMPHSTDEEFMKSSAHSDQNEMQLSRLVLDKGVKGMAEQHAKMMIQDHTESSKNLKALAQTKKVTLPTDMDAEHKTIAEEMRKLSGPELERRFLQQMVTDHQKTLNTMQAHLQMTKDNELRSLITKTTPMIQKHLSLSQQHASM